MFYLFFKIAMIDLNILLSFEEMEEKKKKKKTPFLFSFDSLNQKL